MKPIILIIILSSVLLFSNAQTTPTIWQKQTTAPYPGKQDDIFL